MTQAKTYVNAALALQDLTIAPEWQASVLAHFEVIATAAVLVFAVPLEEEAQAAPIFTP